MRTTRLRTQEGGLKTEGKTKDICEAEAYEHETQEIEKYEAGNS